MNRWEEKGRRKTGDVFGEFSMTSERYVQAEAFGLCVESCKPLSKFWRRAA